MTRPTRSRRRRSGAWGRSFDPGLLDEPGGPPFELAEAFQRLVDAGEIVRGVEIAPTRDLTQPVDLIEHNFAYPRRP